MRKTPLALLLLLLPLAAALAHNGEYRPPLPPPVREDEPPERKPSVTREDGGTATLPPDAATPPPPTAGEVPPPPPPRPGTDRDDDRLTVPIWWEANRHRFLPPPPALPRREALLAALLAAADREEEGVRRRALLALAKAGEAKAFPRLRTAAAKGATIDRAFAVLSLGLLGTDEARELLTKLLGDDDAQHLRSYTVLAIGLAGDPEAAARVRNVLAADKAPNVRAAAALAAGLLGDTKAGSALARIVLGIHHLDGPGVDRAPNLAARAAAARALGEILTPATYRQLLWASDRGPPPVRAAAAIQLARAAGTAGVPSLRGKLGYGNPLPVRQLTLLGLAERGDEVALAEALRMVDSRSERHRTLRPFAALALGLSRFPDYSAILRGVLNDGKAEVGDRAAATLAVGLTGDARAGRALATNLKVERHPRVLGRGALALSLLRSKEASKFARKLLDRVEVPETRRDAVTALGLSGDAKTEEVLVELLADSYHVNREAILALARISPERAATELLAKLSDPNPAAVRFAAYALSVLLDRRRPAVLSELTAHANPLALPPVLRTAIYVENEYLNELIRSW